MNDIWSSGYNSMFCWETLEDNESWHKELKVSTWPPNPPDQHLSAMSPIQWRPHLTGLKGSDAIGLVLPHGGPLSKPRRVRAGSNLMPFPPSAQILDLIGIWGFIYSGMFLRPFLSRFCRMGGTGIREDQCRRGLYLACSTFWRAVAKRRAL